MKNFTFIFLIPINLFFLSSCDLISQSVNTDRQGTSYYISPDGNDSDPGTFDRPWKTIQKVNSMDFKPGDSILFQGGNTFDGAINLDDKDETSAMHNITVSSYGGSRAVINGGDSHAFLALDCDHVRLSDLILKGSGRKSGNISDGAYFENCDSIRIDRLEVYGFQHSGIQVHKSTGARITNVYAHENGFAGIHVTGTTINDPVNYDNRDLYIGYCVAENNPGDPTVTSNHSGNGILVSSVDGGIIEYCEAFNNGWDMPWTGNGPVGIWIWDANDFFIQYCVAHHNKTAEGAHDGGGFDFDGGVSNSIMQYNVSFENEGPGIGLFEFGAAKPWHNNIVRYNLSVNDAHTTKGGLRIWRAEGKGEMHDCDIYNNTIYSGNKDNYAIGILTNCPGMRFFNNIFIYDTDFLPEEHSIVDEKFYNNIYWQVHGEKKIMGYESIEAWARATGNETIDGKVLGIQKNPLLMDPAVSSLPTDPLKIDPENLNTFSVNEGSPAIDAGLNIPEIFSLSPGQRDLAGNKIPLGNTFEIGALEFTR
jgi:hypothetical protein